MNIKFNRKSFLKILGLGTIGSLFPSVYFAAQETDSDNFSVPIYIGTYASAKDKGIYLIKMDPVSGNLRLESSFGGIENPSFLTLDSNKKFLYAVSETDNFNDEKSGALFSFEIKNNKSLSLINKQSTRGAHPCHLCVDEKNNFILVANYTGGNISVIPAKNGVLSEAVEVINHSGSSINKKRQNSPHAHGIVLNKQNTCVFVNDLGIDKIIIYLFDKLSGKLTTSKNRFVEAKPGAGPRHLTFDPYEKYVYSLNELDCTIDVYKYDSNDCTLDPIQTIETLPEEFNGENTCAEIVVAPSGKFIYASNRGHNSIAVYKIDPENGTLSLIQHQATLGKTPRNFAIDPTGKFLIAANQKSNSIVVFRIDQTSGKLKPANSELEIPNPVCILFV